MRRLRSAWEFIFQKMWKRRKNTFYVITVAGTMVRENGAEKKNV